MRAVIHTTIERLAEQQALVTEIRQAEAELHRWRREAERTDLDAGQRRAAAAQAGWYAQYATRRRSELAALRRQDT